MFFGLEGLGGLGSVLGNYLGKYIDYHQYELNKRMAFQQRQKYLWQKGLTVKELKKERKESEVTKCSKFLWTKV
jgi:hypothetical protein